MAFEAFCVNAAAGKSAPSPPFAKTFFKNRNP